MRIYMVICDNADYFNKFFVKANSKKEAINILWNEFFLDYNKESKKKGYEPFYKKELCAMTIEECFYDEKSKIAVIS